MARSGHQNLQFLLFGGPTIKFGGPKTPPKKPIKIIKNLCSSMQQKISLHCWPELAVTMATHFMPPLKIRLTYLHQKTNIFAKYRINRSKTEEVVRNANINRPTDRQTYDTMIIL